MNKIGISTKVNNVHEISNSTINTNTAFRADITQKPDTFEYTNSENTINPPRIGSMRLAFNLLTDEQVEQINKSRKLPENAKFCMNGVGGYSICNNFFNLRVGTQQLPDGFEVKKNIFGFATVLPKGSDGAFLK